jgi:glyoxylase-like metal-dependent hydrolase (beta-lactamase superfamily II)
MEIIEVVATAHNGILNQKTYVLVKGKNAIIIDAGAELEDVKKVVQNKKVLAVLITHSHFDHIWCIEDYVKEWNIPVYISNGAEEKFLDPYKNCSNIIGDKRVFNVESDKIKYFEDDLKFGDFQVEVIKTPGHSADLVSFLIEKNLFPGDLVLGGSVGRTDLYDSDFGEMWNSLEKLKDIDFEVAYPGHYEPMTKQEVLKCF